VAGINKVRVDKQNCVNHVNSVDSVDKALLMDRQKVSFSRNKKYQKKVLWSVLEMSTLFTLYTNPYKCRVDKVNISLSTSYGHVNTLYRGPHARVARA